MTGEQSELSSPESEALAQEYLTRASMFAALATDQPDRRELAWNEFHARYAPVIAGFAKKCGASRQDIDDIIQDVMTGILRVGGEFAYDPNKGRFRGWLKTCTVRSAIRRNGKNLRFRGVPLEELSQLGIAVDAEWIDVWEQQLVARAVLIIRNECGTSLPFRAFEQYVLLDRNAEIVAHELGTSVDSVYQAKTRITKRLREVVQRLTEIEH